MWRLTEPAPPLIPNTTMEGAALRRLSNAACSRPFDLGYTDYQSLRSQSLTVAAVAWGGASVWE